AALFLFAAPPGAPPEQVTRGSSGASVSRITLAAQHGELDLSTGTPRLHFVLVARSTLPVPVEMVEVGVLFAKDEAPLLKADAGGLYQSEPAKDRQVGVVRRRVEVSVPAHGEAPLSLELPLAEGDPDPLAFRTHVLGYRLAEVSVPLLVELLGSDA